MPNSPNFWVLFELSGGDELLPCDANQIWLILAVLGFLGGFWKGNKGASFDVWVLDAYDYWIIMRVEMNWGKYEQFMLRLEIGDFDV